MPKAKRDVPVDAEAADGHQQLLQQLKRMDAAAGDAATGDGAERGTLRERFTAACQTLHVKAALAHIGLLVSLSIYCGVGGLVRPEGCRKGILSQLICARSMRKIVADSVRVC